MRTAWERLKDILRSRLAESSFRIWIEPLEYSGHEGDALVLSCPNAFFASCVQESYLSLLADEVGAGKAVSRIRLVPKTGTEGPVRTQIHLPRFSPTEVARPPFVKGYVFEEFVVGQSNRHAYEVCRATAYDKRHAGQIVYVHARPGLGKSHLAQAVGHAIFEARPSTRISYLSANDFTRQVVTAVRGGDMDAVSRRFSEECDCLLLEEVHGLSGRERTQKELAGTMDRLLVRGKTILLTGCQPPNQIEVCSELCSRFASSLLVAINPPDRDTRRKILVRKARNQGIHLEEAVLDYLADHIQGDIRKIEGAVIGLASRSSLLRQEIDLSLAREMVESIVGKQDGHHRGCHPGGHLPPFQCGRRGPPLKIKETFHHMAPPLAMYLARRLTDASLEEIGQVFNRDHATVVHSVKYIAKHMETSSRIRREVEFVSERIEARRWKTDG